MRHISLIFRHGDRSPTFNAFEPLAVDSALEAAAWALSLPTKKFSETLEKRFPIRTPYATTRDEASLGKNFGSLTGLGVLQMRRLGQWISELSKHHTFVPRRVIASNFRRTQFSAQCLLAGLLKGDQGVFVTVPESKLDHLNIWGTDPVLRKLLRSNGAIGVDIARTTPEEEYAKAIFLRAVPAFGFLIRPFSWISAMDHSMSREGKMGGGGPLRGRSAPQRINEIFEELHVAGSGKLTRENLHLALEQVLQSPFSGSAANKADIEKLINSVDKDGNGEVDIDEFRVFLESIRLPTPHGGVSTQEFEAASKIIESAVSRRFDVILSQPSVRRISAGTMAKTVLSGIDDVLNSAAKTSGENPSPCTIDLYAAHDVTLIPLLKHLGIWDGTKHSWPGVASALAFEVIAKENGANPMVRILLWEGVRGELSGLEPRVLGLRSVSTNLSEHDDSEIIEYERLKSWTLAL